MFNFALSIRNPWLRHYSSWDTVYNKLFKTPFKHKYLEFEIARTQAIIGVSINCTTRQSHPGVYLSIALFSYDVALDFYDHRHWDYKNNRLDLEHNE